MAEIAIARGRLDRGQSLVEMAMVLPLLLILFGGIVDFGLLFQRYEVLTNAAREGARIAVLPGYTDATLIQDRVAAYIATGLGAAPPSGDLTTTVVRNVAVGDFQAVRVTVTLKSTFVILGPIMGLFSGGDWTVITLTAQSTMRCELGDCA